MRVYQFRHIRGLRRGYRARPDPGWPHSGPARALGQPAARCSPAARLLSILAPVGPLDDLEHVDHPLGGVLVRDQADEASVAASPNTTTRASPRPSTPTSGRPSSAAASAAPRPAGSSRRRADRTAPWRRSRGASSSATGSTSAPCRPASFFALLAVPHQPWWGPGQPARRLRASRGGSAPARVASPRRSGEVPAGRLGSLRKGRPARERARTRGSPLERTRRHSYTVPPMAIDVEPVRGSQICGGLSSCRFVCTAGRPGCPPFDWSAGSS